jgi:hypothetical protein
LAAGGVGTPSLASASAHKPQPVLINLTIFLNDVHVIINHIFKM